MSFGEIMRSFLSYCLIIAFSVACGAAKNSDREGNSPTGDGDRGPNRGEAGTRRTLEAESKFDIEAQKYTYSQAYRNSLNIRLTLPEIVEAIQTNKVPNGTFLIPNTKLHIDSKVDSPNPITKKLDCGNSSLSTVKIIERIKDCNDKIGDATASYWSGHAKGINGEGNWSLVSYSNKKKVWQDSRTGLLWSDIVETEEYELAAGLEVDSDDPEEDESAAKKRVCQTDSDNYKDALGNIHESKVHWRLPNRNEYLQADINGARFVLPNTDPNTDQETWTASYAGNSEAWAINQKTGVLRKVNMITKLKVRCIGVPL